MSDPAFHDASELDAVDVPTPTPGSILAAERQLRGWSVEEVAAQLNLAPRQIHAIEADNYSALPGMACARGFIRGYAKTLKIDATPLLAMIPGNMAKIHESMLVRKVVSGTFSESRLPIRKGNALSRSTIVLFAFAGIVGAVSVSHYFGWLPETSESVTTKLKSIASSSAISASGTASANVVGASVAILSNAQPEIPSYQSAPVSTTSESAPGNSSITTAVSGSTPQAQPLLPSQAHDSTPVQRSPSDTKLVLKLREDSWVEVARSNKTTVISRLIKAGNVESIEIAEPVSLTIGNASGVDVTLRGVPLELKSSTKTNVVRLNLK